MLGLLAALTGCRGPGRSGEGPWPRFAPPLAEATTRAPAQAPIQEAQHADGSSQGSAGVGALEAIYASDSTTGSDSRASSVAGDEAGTSAAARPGYDTSWRGERTTAQGDPWLLGVSPSFLPNLGLTATVAREVGTWRGGGLALEAEFTQQFLDDTSFTDSDNPEAGDWSQAKLGARWAKPFDRGRWITVRTGAVWFNARGDPNIINDPGDYLGLFVELGLEARVSKNIIAGPAIATMLAYDGKDREEHVVPQVTWRILFIL